MFPIINRLIAKALASQGLVLANRLAPVFSATILASYALGGKRVGIITLEDEDMAVVKARTGDHLTPFDHWRSYFWGKQ